VEVQFRAVDERLSTDVLHALAHPVRLSALLALEERERTPAQLAATLGVREPVLMSHLHLLDAAGLIEPVSHSGRLRARSTGWADVARRLQQMQDASMGDGEPAD
jgi:DNA-binding transcriptional ArsR family regulator